MSRLTGLLAGALVLGAACARRSPTTEAVMPPPAMQPARVAAPAPVATIDRSSPPVLGPVSALKVPTVVERQLANGLRILVVEHHELPLADVALVIGSGAERNPATHSGLAAVTAQLLSEGTASRSSLQIADQEAFLGVSLQTTSGWDQSAVALHTPTAVLDSALALMADVALHPAFPRAELERVRKERLTDLLQVRDRASEIANRAYASILYGQRHPYGRALAGTEATVQRITRDDVTRFYRTHYRPNNATLIVVGDVSPDDVARRAEALFGAWAKGVVPAATGTSAAQPATTAVYIIDKPGAPQSSVRIGSIGVARSTEEFFPILVMNTILGDAFTSRLNQNLREKRGFTYGAGSGFAMRRGAGPFTARAEVTAAKTDSALMEFMRELRGIRDTVPLVELAKAKNYLQLQLPGEFETTADIAGQLRAIALYDLPLDYFDSYASRIAAVTQADVQRVAERYVTPEHLAVVIVGDRKSIEAGVRAAGIGATEIRDLSGNPPRR